MHSFPAIPVSLCSLCIYLLFGNCIAARAEQPTTKHLRIGVSAALTGPAATYGSDVKNAVSFAAKKLGAGTYEIIVEDDACSAQKALTVAAKFTSIDHVDAVIGPTCSGAAVAVAPVYSRVKIPQLIPNATASGLSEVATYTFAVNPGNRSIAEALAKYVCGTPGKVGVLTEQTEFAQDLKKLFTAACASEIAEEEFLPNTSEFATILVKLKTQQKVEKLVLIPQTETGLSTIVQELTKQGWTVPRYAFYFPGSPAFLKLAGDAANGMVYADWPQASEMLSPEGMRLFEEYRAEFPVQTIEANFAYAFESVRAIAKAFESSEDPHEFLTHTSFMGVFGPWSFGEKRRLSNVTPVLKKIEQGNVIAVSTKN